MPLWAPWKRKRDKHIVNKYIKIKQVLSTRNIQELFVHSLKMQNIAETIFCRHHVGLVCCSSKEQCQESTTM